MKRPAPLRIVALIGLAIAAGAGAVAGSRAWWYDAELSKAEREMVTIPGEPEPARLARLASARDRLASLSTRWPGRDEVEYPLGVCLATLGEVVPALDAWGRVPASSSYASRAAIDRARLALQHGRLAVAEEALARVINEPGTIGEDAAGMAAQVDLFSGRGYRMKPRIERRWRTSPDPVAPIRTHWLNDTQPYPVDAVREALERYGREAPDDDRVWLGRADLATRTGRFEEADAWLKRCEARRPDDPDVGRARLTWALDSGRVDDAVRACTRLDPARFTDAEIAALAARIAGLRGDPAAERAATERLVDLAPGDAEAWRHLADLASRDGPSGAELRTRAVRRKAEIDRLSDEYRMLMGLVGQGHRSRTVELARVAESLGRRFEAQAWWTLHARAVPGDPEARAALGRLVPLGSTARPQGRTLAEVLNLPAPASTASSSIAGPVVPTFRDDAETAGLRFVYDNAPSSLARLPETMGGGVGLIDVDGDGWLDVYAVQGGKFPPPPGDTSPNGDRLFLNKHDGTFEDITTRSGLTGFRRGFGHGVAVGDFDGDGHPDLFVTRWRSYALYRNRGDGTFEDATERAGLGGDRGWPTSAAFADLDDDGDLDLYVCQYLKWDPATTPPCPDPDRPGRHLYCSPRAFDAEPDRVFRNDGGRFVDVTAEAGFVDREGRGLGVVVADLDGDGRVDIFVANDMTANYVYRNLGGFRFEEVGVASGAGSNAAGGYQAGMGVACGDIDGDGVLDLSVTNFFGESTSFFKGLGKGLFADRTVAVGLAAPTRHVLGFGLTYLDADNDGRLDIAEANGHVNDYSPSIPHAMPAQLLLGTRGGRLADVSARAGACWNKPIVGRGLACGDIDNDGRVDLLILSQGGPLAYFHNLGPAGRSLTIQLQGTGRSNRDAVGATVRLTSGGRTQLAPRLAGGSFLSASDGRLRFGLERETTAGIEIRWPDGRVERHEGLKADAGYHVVEGEARPRPLKGWRSP